MSTRATLAKEFWDRSLPDLFQTLEATPAGLTTDEANRRFRCAPVYGSRNPFAVYSATSVVVGYDCVSRRDLPGAGTGR